MVQKKPTILCIDDEPAVLEPIAIMLRRRGFEPLTAPNGKAALELFRNYVVDAVVLDYVMPDLNGGAVAEAIRKLDSDVPIILHTGYADIEDPRLEAVTCTLPKGSLSFLVVKLHDVLAAAQSQKPRAMHATAAGPAA